MRRRGQMAFTYACDVICPKCQGRMVTFNRHGLNIEQCENCRGIFLDRGELEQIVNAEQHHYGGAPGFGGGHYQDSPAPYRGGHPPAYGGGHYKDSPPPYGGGRYRDSPPPYGGGRRRKKSFLEELFD